MVVQVVPSTDEYAVTSVPRRTSLTQRGAPASSPAVWMLVPPLTGRRWNASPFEYETSAKACADPADSDERIMTPVFAQVDVGAIASTRARISMLPGTARYAKWNWSLVPQMSA